MGWLTGWRSNLERIRPWDYPGREGTMEKGEGGQLRERERGGKRERVCESAYLCVGVFAMCTTVHVLTIGDAGRHSSK